MKPYKFDVGQDGYRIVDAVGNVAALLPGANRLTAERFVSALNDYDFHRGSKAHIKHTNKTALLESLESALRDRRASYKDRVLDGVSILEEYSLCSTHTVGKNGESDCPPYNIMINKRSGRDACRYDVKALILIQPSGEKIRIYTEPILTEEKVEKTGS